MPMSGGYLPPVVVEITATDKQFDETLLKDEALLKKFADTKVDVIIRADSKLLVEELAQTETSAKLAGEQAGRDFTSGLYTKVFSSPDWKIIRNIARDAFGNQLQLTTAGEDAGDALTSGLYTKVFSSPDWKLIKNIARDSFGNQLQLTQAGEAAGDALMSGLYTKVFNSPDWKLIKNIARDSMGNQLMLPAGGTTGTYPGPSSGSDSNGNAMGNIWGMLSGMFSKGGGGGAAAAGGGAAGGSGAGAIAGLGGAGTTAFATFLHISHLLMPEILGLVSAVGSVVLGFGALGVASAGTLADIATGLRGVSSAQDNMIANVPGTIQWSQATVQLGQAWEQIPSALQPAVASIRGLMNHMMNSPMAHQIQQFWGGQANILTHLFSGMGNVFQPLILATERAMVTVEGIISKSMGSGKLTHFVSTLSAMVGPATIEIGQLLLAIGKIAMGFMSAIQAGKGMEALVSLFRNLANAVNSPMFKGFVSGWVDFDRLISTAIGVISNLFSLLGNLGAGVSGLATILGFLISALVAAKSAMYVLGRMGVKTTQKITTAGNESEVVATKFGKMTSKLKQFTLGAAGIGMAAVGINGLIGNVTSLAGVTNPLPGLWNTVAGSIGLVSRKAGGAVNSISKYQGALHGAIPVTKLLTAANAALLHAQQSIGSSLAGTQTGFASFTAITSKALSAAQSGFGKSTTAITNSYNAMIGNLNTQNGALITWGVDSQKLLKAGVNPSMVASMVQQDPAAISTAWDHIKQVGSTAINQMNVTWDEHLMGMQASGQKGFGAVFSAAQQAITSGTPTMVQAGKAMMLQIGKSLNIPYTGTQKSMDKIAAALHVPGANAIALQGHLTKDTSAMLAASNKANTAAKSTSNLGSKMAAAKKPAASLGGTLLSMATNLGMTIGGLGMFGSAFKPIGGKMLSFTKKVGSGMGSLVGKMATGFGKIVASGVKGSASLIKSGAKWVAETGKQTASFVADHAKAAAKIMAKWAGTVASLIADGAKWLAKMIAKVAVNVATNVAGAATTAAAWIAANAMMILGILAVVAIVVLVVYEIIKHWSSIKKFFIGLWHTIESDAKRIWNAVIAWFGKLPGRIVGAFKSAGTLLYDIGKNIITGLINGVKAMASSVVNAVKNVVKSAVSGVKNFLGIKSPSVVFQQIGQYSMMGWQQGILQGSGMVTNALATTAQNGVMVARQNTLGMNSIGLNNRTASGMQGGMQGGLEVHAVFQINAPGGNAEAIKNAVEQDSAHAFAQQVLTSIRSGAGTLY